MSGDLIRRDAVLKEINCWIGSGEYRYAMSERFLIDRIKTLPPVNPQEPKTGHWIEVLDGEGFIDGNPIKLYHYECSECRCENANWGTHNYCPNCGADMRGDTE